MRNNSVSKRLKYMTFAAAGLFFILVILLCVRSVSRRMNIRAEAGQRVEYYISIPVCPGDSLWKISKQYYSSEYKNMNQYMRKIMNLNHMESEKINAGASLIVPYYDYTGGRKDLPPV